MSLKESINITPVVIVFVLLLGSSHLASLGLDVAQHVAGRTRAAHRWTTHVVAGTAHAHTAWWTPIVVAVATRATVAAAIGTAHHNAFCFLFTVEDHQLFGEVLVLHTELLTDLDETTEAVDVIRVLSMNVFIDLEGLVEQVHAAVARGDHELPLDLTRLDLECTLKVYDGLLELVLLSMMHAKARDHIDFCGVVPVGLLVVVHSLELVLLLLI